VLLDLDTNTETRTHQEITSLSPSFSSSIVLSTSTFPFSSGNLQRPVSKKIRAVLWLVVVRCGLCFHLKGWAMSI
jgi:hypothetical protein